MDVTLLKITKLHIGRENEKVSRKYFMLKDEVFGWQIREKNLATFRLWPIMYYKDWVY